MQGHCYWTLIMKKILYTGRYVVSSFTPVFFLVIGVAFAVCVSMKVVFVYVILYRFIIIKNE